MTKDLIWDKISYQILLHEKENPIDPWRRDLKKIFKRGKCPFRKVASDHLSMWDVESILRAEP